MNFKTSLIIENITKDDYSQYERLAHNLEDESFATVELSEPTKPNAPLDFQVINITEKSAEFKWLPGFSGGLQVYYRLRYKIKNEDVKPGSLNYSLTDLKPNAKYLKSIMALNEAGNVQYFKDIEVHMHKGKLLVAPVVLKY